MYDLLLFDLDGTLSDPMRGAHRCINHALVSCGHLPVEEARIGPLIGPPLDFAFESILGDSASPALIEELIARFRVAYGDGGYAECHLYPGVRDALLQLEGEGAALAVCTSKRSDFAERVLQTLEIRELFTFVDGGDIRRPKWMQIEELRRAGTISDRTLMIGDRAVDLVAASRNGIDSAGVLWGYGARAELEVEAPRYLFAHPAEWATLLRFDPPPRGSSRRGEAIAREDA